MNRRSFLRGGGLFGIFLGCTTAPVVAASTALHGEKVPNDIKQQLETTPMTLSLKAGYREKISDSTEKLRITPDGNFLLNPNLEHTIEKFVSLKPGPDRNLYITINGEWKKVLTN